VTAVTECQLLTLDVADFRRLLAAHPDLEAAVRRVASQRLGAQAAAVAADVALRGAPGPGTPPDE
jgi:CRP-like cAMP-binding protein